MSTLDRKHIARLETGLVERRRELVAEIGGKLDESREHSSNTTIEQRLEGGDQALAALIADTDMTIAGRSIEELRDVQAALERIAGNTYGDCIDCAGPIAPERLDAYPTAKRCAQCQEVYERMRGRTTGRTL